DGAAERTLPKVQHAEAPRTFEAAEARGKGMERENDRPPAAVPPRRQTAGDRCVVGIENLAAARRQIVRGEPLVPGDLDAVALGQNRVASLGIAIAVDHPP